MRRLNGWLVAGALAVGCTAPEAGAQVVLCDDADDYLVSEASMTTVVELDTIDDWRTDQVVEGCRITAAGLTRSSLRLQSRRFFDGLPGSGWSRTPDPQDAPNESSIRFRKNDVDCLFSFYSGGLLGTDAEFEVDDAVVPGPRERRYNFLVQCMPAMEASPPQ